MITGKHKSGIELQSSEVDWELAHKVHTDYAQKSGAQHIATEFALAHLSALVRAVKPTDVLEFGAGIETISQLLLDHSNGISHATATERNTYCIERLTASIAVRFAGRFELVTDPLERNFQRQHFDLIIIDGLLDPGQYDALERDSYCFVGGSRKSTRKIIIEQIKRRHLTMHFVDYNQGVRYFNWSTKHADGRDRLLPKFKFRKILKGCWVGQVSNLATP